MRVQAGHCRDLESKLNYLQNTHLVHKQLPMYCGCMREDWACAWDVAWDVTVSYRAAEELVTLTQSMYLNMH